MPCHFVRFGGCDFRCTWCDTPHAVLPDLVAKLDRMSAYNIFYKVNTLGKRNDFIRWVVLTGGNPGLLDLELLIGIFHKAEYKVMVETQGSTYRRWYGLVDDLCFSPKPPSSGMAWSFTDFARILNRMHQDKMQKAVIRETPAPPPYLKVPIFSSDDLDFAEKVHAHWPDLELFLSIGNIDPTLPTVGFPDPSKNPMDHYVGLKPTRDVVLDSFREWTEYVISERPSLQDCRIFPQQHTLIWGNERGH